MSTLFVLENDPQRLAAMRIAIATAIPFASATFVDNVPDAIAWLSINLPAVNVISLDHDLGPERTRDGNPFDPGTGRDIANYLAERSPACPVIIHTDNFFVRPTMQAALDRGKWLHTWVAPGNGTGWVLRDWIPKVTAFLVN